MSAFPTGVAIVTTLDEDGEPKGLTTNAICSVSADPPMLRNQRESFGSGACCPDDLQADVRDHGADRIPPERILVDTTAVPSTRSLIRMPPSRAIRMVCRTTGAVLYVTGAAPDCAAPATAKHLRREPGLSARPARRPRAHEARRAPPEQPAAWPKKGARVGRPSRSGVAGVTSAPRVGLEPTTLRLTADSNEVGEAYLAPSSGSR